MWYSGIVIPWRILQSNSLQWIFVVHWPGSGVKPARIYFLWQKHIVFNNTKLRDHCQIWLLALSSCELIFIPFYWISLPRIYASYLTYIPSEIVRKPLVSSTRTCRILKLIWKQKKKTRTLMQLFKVQIG